MSGRISPTILGEGEIVPGIGLPPTFWSLMVSLGTVMATLLFSLLMCYSEHILRIKV